MANISLLPAPVRKMWTHPLTISFLASRRNLPFSHACEAEDRRRGSDSVRSWAGARHTYVPGASRHITCHPMYYSFGVWLSLFPTTVPTSVRSEFLSYLPLPRHRIYQRPKNANIVPWFLTVSRRKDQTCPRVLCRSDGSRRERFTRNMCVRHWKQSHLPTVKGVKLSPWIAKKNSIYPRCIPYRSPQLLKRAKHKGQNTLRFVFREVGVE
ncbi:unnamed protein product [Ectocarpus sp. 12 AP-2014]